MRLEKKFPRKLYINSSPKDDVLSFVCNVTFPLFFTNYVVNQVFPLVVLISELKQPHWDCDFKPVYLIWA